jgi:hypothetical protein
MSSLLFSLAASAASSGAAAGAMYCSMKKKANVEANAFVHMKELPEPAGDGGASVKQGIDAFPKRRAGMSAGDEDAA